MPAAPSNTVSPRPAHAHSGYKCKPAHLLAHVRLEVLVRSDVEAYTAVLEGGCFDLVCCARHGGDDDV